MKGFISKTLAAVGVLSGLTVGGGCVANRDLVDPCWPERYNYAARKEVCAAFTPQVHNGRVIEQSLWSCDFEPKSQYLSAEGREHLKSLLQRRPYPDMTIYLATAQEFKDLAYDPANPDKFAERRCELDTLRQQEVQKYLTAQTAGRNLCFHIVIHDPAEVGHELRGIPVNRAVESWYGSFRGNLVGAGGGGGGATTTTVTSTTSSTGR
jgi:hypothetical protein